MPKHLKTQAHQTRLKPFEYKVFKTLQSLPVPWATTKILVSCSGGKDSVALFHILINLRKRLGFQIAMAHVHHGRSASKKTATFRNKAKKLCQKLARENQVECFVVRHEGDELSSEAEFRDFRKKAILQTKKLHNFDFVVLAHHANDLLETRLIRLIRGTGAQGLNAMTVQDGMILRPLIHQTAESINRYIIDEKLSFVSDPSNSEDQFLRNWLRNTWLPQLESKRPGSRATISRSLQGIVDEFEVIKTNEGETEHDIVSFKLFTKYSTTKKRQVLARVMLKRGARDFSRRQIDEILKRLRTHELKKRSKLSFEVAGLKWVVNAEQIQASKL